MTGSRRQIGRQKGAEAGGAVPTCEALGRGRTCTARVTVLITIATMIMTSSAGRQRAPGQRLYSSCLGAHAADGERTSVVGYPLDQLDVVGDLFRVLRPRLHTFATVVCGALRPDRARSRSLALGLRRSRRRHDRKRLDHVIALHRGTPSGTPAPVACPSSASPVLRSATVPESRALDRELLVVRPPLSPRWGAARLARTQGCE